MSAASKRWWRAAALGLVVGVAVGGGWFGLTRFAQAGPIRPPLTTAAPVANEKAEPAPVWTRASSQVVNASDTDPKASAVPAPAPVTPASAALPAIPLPPAPTVPVPTPPDAVAPVAPAVPALPAETAQPPVLPLPSPTPLLPLPPMGTPGDKGVRKDDKAGPGVPPPPGLAPPAPPVNSAPPLKPALPAAPDFNLRPGNAGNSVKADGPITAPEAVKPVSPVAPMIPAAPSLPGPGIPAVLTADRPKPADVPLGPSDKYVFPLPAAPGLTGVPTPPATADTFVTAPGDRTMNLKQSAVAAAIGGALAFAPANSVVALPLPMKSVAADAKDQTVDERLKGIEKKLDDLTQALRGKKDSDGYPLPSDPGLVEEVKRLRNEVASLKAQVAGMPNTTAIRPPTGTESMAGKGTVRVVNDYPVEITIVVNDKSHRVAPNTKLDVPVLAGDFSYQLLSAGSNLTPTKSVIKEKEVVTLRIK